MVTTNPAAAFDPGGELPVWVWTYGKRMMTADEQAAIFAARKANMLAQAEVAEGDQAGAAITQIEAAMTHAELDVVDVAALSGWLNKL